MACVDAHDRPIGDTHREISPYAPGRLIGLQGRLARPFWGIAGAWAAFCGALASDHLHWTGQDLLSLALVLLMAELGWGSLWDLSTGIDWARLLREGWPRVGSTPLGGLPYTQPTSPAGRLLRGLVRLSGWFQRVFWPAAGSALLGLLATAGLTSVVALLLPQRLYPLHAAVAGLVLVGALFRRLGKVWLAGHALLQVGLGWMAGHMAFAQWRLSSLVMAAVFSLAVWGVFRATQGLPRAFWLVNGGQVAGSVALFWLRQPLAASLVGLLVFAQVALQPSLRVAHKPERVVSRLWLWILVAMLVAVLALP